MKACFFFLVETWKAWHEERQGSEATRSEHDVMHCCLFKGRVQPALQGCHQDPVLCWEEQSQGLEKNHLWCTPSFSKEHDHSDTAKLAGGRGGGKKGEIWGNKERATTRERKGSLYKPWLRLQRSAFEAVLWELEGKRAIEIPDIPAFIRYLICNLKYIYIYFFFFPGIFKEHFHHTRFQSQGSFHYLGKGIS